jgi:hypothetical protein
MMAMSDLAVVGDANAVLDELERLLPSECEPPPGGSPGTPVRSGTRVVDGDRDRDG